MASFKVHEDQENLPALRQKMVLPNNQRKRSVLGVLDNKPERLLIGKQANGKCIGAENQKRYALGCIPTVPVAQFEAFKVYEDAPEEVAKCENDNIYDNVYNGTEEDRFVTKKEVKEMAARLQQQAFLDEKDEEGDDPDKDEIYSISLDPEFDKVISDTPMSVDKSLCEDLFAGGCKGERDYFFELPEYRDGIIAHLFEREKLNRPKAGYMKKQPDITYEMRAVLVDWLVEVTQEYKLHNETLYLAVNYIDRFLSYMAVKRGKLQLVGTAAMFIASKYEEIYPPDVGEFVYITDDTYNKRQVTSMEILILRILDFELSVPTPYTFINSLCLATDLPDNIMYLAMYVSELSLLEGEPVLEMLPSAIAASSIAIALHTLHKEPWSDSLREVSGYTLKDIEPTIKFLSKLYSNASSLLRQAIQSKYKSSKYMQVATIPPREIEIEIA